MNQVLEYFENNKETFLLYLNIIKCKNTIRKNYLIKLIMKLN